MPPIYRAALTLALLALLLGASPPAQAQVFRYARADVSIDAGRDGAPLASAPPAAHTASRLSGALLALVGFGVLMLVVAVLIVASMLRPRRRPIRRYSTAGSGSGSWSSSDGGSWSSSDSGSSHDGGSWSSHDGGSSSGGGGSGGWSSHDGGSSSGGGGSGGWGSSDSGSSSSSSD